VDDDIGFPQILIIARFCISAVFGEGLIKSSELFLKTVDVFGFCTLRNAQTGNSLSELNELVRFGTNGRHVVFGECFMLQLVKDMMKLIVFFDTEAFSEIALPDKQIKESAARMDSSFIICSPKGEFEENTRTPRPDTTAFSRVVFQLLPSPAEFVCVTPPPLVGWCRGREVRKAS